MCKVTKEAQCCASTAQELQETFLKVMCQQVHGTGEFGEELPWAHLENEDEQKSVLLEILGLHGWMDPW